LRNVALPEEGPTWARKVRIPFTWFCVGIALPLAVTLGALGPYGANTLPLLTALFMTVLGTLVSVMGTGVCLFKLRHGSGSGIVLAKTFLCLCMGGLFIWTGIGLWPAT
jgi:hypothetical protein